MRVASLAGVAAVVTLALACSNQSAVGPSPVTAVAPASSQAVDPGASSGTMGRRLSATVRFGLEDVGSGFPPDAGHDQSGHANDTLVPQTVVIDKGGTVTFEAVSIHQIAIYEPGKGPEDVQKNLLTAMPCPFPLPPFLIDDPDQRIPINGLNPTGCGPRTYTHTFADPGRYLVICSVLPHFEIKMYGWVVVRDR